jgi:hypothetical protein
MFIGMNTKINPAMMIKLMGAKNQFEQTHPKFAAFFGTIMKQGVEEGSVIEITVTRPDGTPVTANMKVQHSDIELIQQLRELAGNE